MKTKNLKELLPIFCIEQDCLVSRSGDVTVGYRLHLPEIFSLADSDYEAFHQAWVRAIRLLPPRCVLHKQDWYVLSQVAPKPDVDTSGFFDRHSNRYFHERPFLEHSSYVFLSQSPTSRRPSSSLFSTLLRPHLVPTEWLGLSVLQEFLEQCGQFVRVLEDSGFVQVTRIPSSDFTSTPETAGLLERYATLSATKEKIIRDISFHNGIRVGDQHAQLFTLCDMPHLPRLCGPRIQYDPYSTDRTSFPVGYTAALGQLLPCNHLYNQYVFIADPAVTLRQLESKQLRLQSLSAYSRANATARDATHAFLQEAMTQQRVPVKAHFNVLAWSDQPAKLKDIKNLVTSALAQSDAVPKQELDGAYQIYWAGVPGNAADFPMNDTFDTFAEQASCFFTVETGYRDSISPIGIRLGDRLTGKPVHVDLSDEPVRRGICTNRNKFILGPSGSGKSFFTNHLVRTYYEQGTHVVLVDVGHSYRGLCDLVNGYYFTYTEKDPIRFNPFYLSPADVLDTEKKESIKTLLLALWKKDNETFGRSEYVALSDALQLYFEHLRRCPELFPCFDTFYEYVQVHFAGKLQKDQVKEKEFDLPNFLYVLRPYYKGGEFDYLLNARSHLDLLSQRFIVFELDNIKDHPILFPVVTLIIMEVFISKMRKLKGVRKMILIEEAWKAIAREGMAEYIKYLFKTVRKFFGEAIVVTQEVEDIISSPIVKQAIINSSDCKILLDQSKYQHKFEQIQQLLGLTEKEKAMVLSVNRANDPARRYKEVFISLGGTLSRVYRTEVSPQEYFVYTTEEKEKVLVQEYAQRYGSVEKGIEILVKELEEKKNIV